MPHQTYISPDSQQVLLHLFTYVHAQRHQVTLGPHVTITCLALKHWIKFVTTMLTPQTYTKMSSQDQLAHCDYPSKSLLYFSELHISLSILHEEATLVRNMLQPTNTTDTQCAESARTMSTQYSTLETMYHTSANSLTTGPCLQWSHSTLPHKHAGSTQIITNCTHTHAQNTN